MMHRTVIIIDLKRIFRDGIIQELSILWICGSFLKR